MALSRRRNLLKSHAPLMLDYIQIKLKIKHYTDNRLRNNPAMELKTLLAKNLSTLMSARKDLDTQTKLSKRAGLAQSTIQRILASEVHTGLDVLAQLAAAFRVSPVSLITEANLRLDTPTGADADLLRNWHRLSAEQQAQVHAYLNVCLLTPVRTHESDFTFDTLELAKSYQSLPRETAADIAHLKRTHSLAMHVVEDARMGAETETPTVPSNLPAPPAARRRRAPARVE